MVKRTFAGFELDCNWMVELFKLLIGKDLPNGLHVASETRDREQIPFVAARNVLQTAIVLRAVIESDPASEVRHRLGFSPVRIILMPGHDAAVMGRFAEELIVPHSDRAAQKLCGRDTDGGVPEKIVKPGAQSPGAEGMEENGVRSCRFVGVVFVPEFGADVVRIEESAEFFAKKIDLVIIEDAKAGQIAVYFKEVDLLSRQAVWIEIRRVELREQVGERGVVCGEVVHGFCDIWNVSVKLRFATKRSDAMIPCRSLNQNR